LLAEMRGGVRDDASSRNEAVRRISIVGDQAQDPENLALQNPKARMWGIDFPETATSLLYLEGSIRIPALSVPEDVLELFERDLEKVSDILISLEPLNSLTDLIVRPR